ncbi:helix-turn-helix transcriptional regulator [Flagellimonas sp. HMM57]|uniref:helix-turn-helix transcriptional regulator n=1 Tax=unclassified Flagellimonas TaxID=2644544 RepID=UPI0013D09116|nr:MULTISPECIES: helix-turn-helix transcriptional regulator [unclassified Flagellimonas]UII76378.1 helix-turn-helix transcriptional regulator [Flagellimonas sp. HMM57]
MKILKKGNYYGIRKLELENTGVSFSEYDYHLPKTDWHYHENPYFMYVLEGNLKDINQHKTTLCPPGSFLFHNWEETHMNTKETVSARGFHIELDRQWFQNKKLDTELWEGSKIMKDPRLHETLAKIYYEFKKDDDDSKLSMDVLMLQLCDEIWGKNLSGINMEPYWIDQLKQLIYDDVENLTLTSLSNTLGIHPVHLSRSLPKYLNTTLGDYIRRNKIKKAIPLLGNRSLSLTEIAHECGFSDHSHFTRTFKSYFSETPKRYRQRFF